jgi:GT2 family glycosyltransferase
LLERFLPSVLRSARHYLDKSGAPVEVLVVDDGSSDTTLSWLLDQGFLLADSAGTGEAPLELTCLRLEQNCGFGCASNRGVAAARHPLVLLLNNDVELEADSIAPLVEGFDDPAVFAVHCRVFDLDSGRECGTGKRGGFSRGFIRVHGSYVCASYLTTKKPVPLYSMFAGGGSAMFDRQKFLNLGGFEPLLAPFYWEDVELSYRAWKRGMVVLYEPRSVARHRVSSTIGQLKRGKVRRIEQRNRLLYHWIHLHDRRLLMQHILWVILLTVTAPLRLRPGFVLSVLSALWRLSAALERRRQQKSAAVRKDREVLSMFEELTRNPDLVTVK